MSHTTHSKACFCSNVMLARSKYKFNKILKNVLAILFFPKITFMFLIRSRVTTKILFDNYFSKIILKNSF